MRNLKPTTLEQLKLEIEQLATAKERPIEYLDSTECMPTPMPNYKAIINEKTNEVECVASKDYVLIQHKEAFGSVLYALETAAAGRPLRAGTEEQNGRAWMTVVFSDIKANISGSLGIELGIKAVNSYDKTSALKYSGTAKENEAGHFEFFGLRLDDMSAMTLKVPLSDLDFVGDKENVQNAQSYIRHYGKNTHLNVEKVNAMILALPAVAKKLEEKVLSAIGKSMTEDMAYERLGKAGFGARTRVRIMELFKLEAHTVWGLYKSVTYYATHDQKVSALSTERLLKMAEGLI